MICTKFIKGGGRGRPSLDARCMECGTIYAEHAKMASSGQSIRARDSDGNEQTIEVVVFEYSDEPPKNLAANGRPWYPGWQFYNEDGSEKKNSQDDWEW